MSERETHHALVYAAPSLSTSAVPTLYQTQSVDVQHVIVDRFSIQDARSLIAQANQKGVSSGGRTFVIVTQNIPVEAQNALLKLFEEPPTGVQFHLVIPQIGILIPTLRSRVQVIEDEKTVSTGTVFKEFLAASYADRLDTIADVTKRKDVVYIEQLLTEAEVHLSRDVLKHTNALRSLVFVRSYIKTPGASAKMLLEEFALSLDVS